MLLSALACSLAMFAHFTHTGKMHTAQLLRTVYMFLYTLAVDLFANACRFVNVSNARGNFVIIDGN